MAALVNQSWLVDILVNLLVSGIVLAIGARSLKCTPRTPFGDNVRPACRRTAP